MDLDVTLLVGIGGAAIVAALVEVIKKATAMSEDPWCRWNALVAIGLGVAWNALIGSMVTPAFTWQTVVLQGLLSGLAASGLYSGVKSAAGK